MSEVILNGEITKWEIGKSAVTNTDITNILYFRVERIHEIIPMTVSSQKTPKGYLQKHSWVIFEIALLGYNTAITTVDVCSAVTNTQPAYDEDGDSYEMDYCVITYLDTSKTEKKTEFTEAYLMTSNMSVNDREDSITIIRGIASYKTDS